MFCPFTNSLMSGSIPRITLACVVKGRHVHRIIPGGRNIERFYVQAATNMHKSVHKPSGHAAAGRLLRLSQSVDVLPSLSVAPALAPSRADLDTFILRLALQNLQVSTVNPKVHCYINRKKGSSLKSCQRMHASQRRNCASGVRLCCCALENGAGDVQHNAQGSQALCVQQLSCMGSPWRISSLATRSSSSSRGSSADGGAGGAAVGGVPSGQLLPDVELPPSTSSFAYLRLHPPDQAGLPGAPAEQPGGVRIAPRTALCSHAAKRWCQSWKCCIIEALNKPLVCTGCCLIVLASESSACFLLFESLLVSASYCWVPVFP